MAKKTKIPYCYTIISGLVIGIVFRELDLFFGGWESWVLIFISICVAILVGKLVYK